MIYRTSSSPFILLHAVINYAVISAGTSDFSALNVRDKQLADRKNIFILGTGIENTKAIRLRKCKL